MSHELDILAKKLASRTPSPRGRIAASFKECYALLEEKLQDKVAVKEVLEDFNAAYALNVSIATFRKMLQEKRKQLRQHLPTSPQHAEGAT